MNLYISSNINENKKELVELARINNLGIEICDFVDPVILNNKLDIVIKDYQENLTNFSENLCIHAPFFDLNNMAIDNAVKKLTIYRYKQCLKVAKILQPKTIVFHTGYNAMVKMGFYLDYFKEKQIKFWKESIKPYEDAGIIVTLENTYEQAPEIINTIIDEVNSDKFKLCIDTGHANIYSNVSVYEWIKISGNRLHHMHVHNNSGIYDDHNSILDGNIDFLKVINILKENNLDPDLSIEVFDQKIAIDNAIYLKKILANN